MEREPALGLEQETGRYFLPVHDHDVSVEEQASRAGGRE